MVAEVVLFDVGGVLSGGGPREREVARILGLGSAAMPDVRRAIWAYREGYDLGMPEDEYWSRVAADCGLKRGSPTLERLIDEDRSQWAQPFPEVVPLLAALRNSRTRTVVLSNASHLLGEYFVSRRWTRGVFERCFFSADTGYAKPNPRAFEIALEAVGVEPAQVTFFDDREVNVAAACSLGIDGRVWERPGMADRVAANLGVS